MEQKIKYQYSYFIYPYLVEEKKYNKYLLKLLKDKKCELKIFEKEKDLNLYTYFLPNIREKLFWSFGRTRRQIKSLNELEDGVKANLLAKNECNIFEYSLGNVVQGKMGQEGGSGIFFNIQKIEIICFKSGICFLLLKTIVEDDDKFSDILNFNYKFREINADYSFLKDYENIRLQTNNLKDIKELSTIINKITGPTINTKDMNLDVEKFITYSYACVEQDSWNIDNDFENIKEEFIKFTNVLPSSYQVNLNEKLENEKILETRKYAKIGFNKQSTALLTSSASVENYTKLPFIYEREYLYTYILALYKKLYLKKINLEFMQKRNFAQTREKFLKFTSDFWIQEITNDMEGSLMYEKWRKTLELDYLYNEIKNKYDITYKDLNIEKTNKINLAIIVILAVTLTFNIINFILLYFKGK